jgi:putative flippase GtrA
MPVDMIRQGAHFLLVGIALVCVDWLVFVAVSAVGVAPVPANVLGRIAGALLGFVLNGTLTFGRIGAPRLGRRRFGRYAALWIGLTLLSTMLVASLSDRLGLQAAWIAKPAVEAAMAALSFVVSRQWVYG